MKLCCDEDVYTEAHFRNAQAKWWWQQQSLSQCCSPNSRLWGRGQETHGQCCCSAILSCGSPASLFSILPGHFGNSLKKIAALNPVSSKKKICFAPWSFCVVGVHPAIGSAAFSGATNSQYHQYIN